MTVSWVERARAAANRNMQMMRPNLSEWCLDPVLLLPQLMDYLVVMLSRLGRLLNALGYNNHSLNTSSYKIDQSPN